MEQLVFTPAGLLDLLLQIDQLNDCSIQLTETLDGQLQLQIDDDIYIIQPKVEDSVAISETAADELQEANNDAYADLQASGEVSIEDLSTVVESGVIKELAKTLLVGGLVRLTNKLLKKDQKK